MPKHATSQTPKLSKPSIPQSSSGDDNAFRSQPAEDNELSRDKRLMIRCIAYVRLSDRVPELLQVARDIRQSGSYHHACIAEYARVNRSVPCVEHAVPHLVAVSEQEEA